jgi:O-antigen/teichoic acid export membrane protein
VLGLSVLGALATALLSAVVVVAGAALGWANASIWLLLPVAVLGVEASQTAEMWLTRVERFRAITLSRVAQSVATVGVQVGVGIVAAAALGLVGGTAAGFAAGALVAGAVALRTRDRPLSTRWRADALLRLAHRYARFPLFSAPAALLNLIATRAPVLLLAIFATDAAVGHFGVAFGTIALPLGLVTGSIGQVFFVRAAEAHRSGSLVPLTRQIVRGLLAVTAFPTLAVLVAGPTLFSFVFGPEWETAGHYAQRIAPWVMAASVASPLTALFDVLERQRADLGFSVFMATVQTGVLVLAGYATDAAGMILAASVAGTLLRGLHVGWMLRLAGVPLRRTAWDLLRALALAAPFAAVLFVVDATGAGGAWVFATTVVGGVAAFLLASRTARAQTASPRLDAHEG